MKKMYDGVFEMVDEEMGEKVIVWGVEDVDYWFKFSVEDLKWKFIIVVMVGDVLEEGWYKVMEVFMVGFLGVFSVKGVC